MVTRTTISKNCGEPVILDPKKQDKVGRKRSRPIDKLLEKLPLALSLQSHGCIRRWLQTYVNTIIDIYSKNVLVQEKGS